jgi:hypothetical protein
VTASRNSEAQRFLDEPDLLVEPDPRGVARVRGEEQARDRLGQLPDDLNGQLPLGRAGLEPACRSTSRVTSRMCRSSSSRALVLALLLTSRLLIGALQGVEIANQVGLDLRLLA